jgi:exonuclease III
MGFFAGFPSARQTPTHAAGDRSTELHTLARSADFNVAPLEHDVWSHKHFPDVVSHTPQEVERLNAIQRSIGWVDVVRHFVPEAEKLYT